MLELSFKMSVADLVTAAVYAKENGRGMLFPDEPEDSSSTEPDDTDPPENPSPGSKGKPSLKIVK